MTGNYYAIGKCKNYVIHLSYKDPETGKHKKKSVSTSVPVEQGLLTKTAQKRLDRQMNTLIDEAIKAYGYLEKPDNADILFSDWIDRWFSG